jgi:polyhydroxybutyrate depolymerase
VGQGVKAGQPSPLLLLFHGRGGNGEAIEEYSGLRPLSDEAGFILVSPDGTGSPQGWGAGASMPGWPTDDVAFGAALLSQLQSDFCIDLARIMAAGHSNGAFMAAKLACENADITGVAMVSGVDYPQECPAGPRRALVIHSSDDEVVPYGGGLIRETYVYDGVQAEAAEWARGNGCSLPAVTDGTPAAVTRTHYADCTEPLEVIIVSGAGHGWPGTAGTELAASFSSAREIWEFLAADPGN